jgi:hypothetical protein
MKRYLLLLLITSAICVAQTKKPKTIEQLAKEFVSQSKTLSIEQQRENVEKIIYSSKWNSNQKAEFITYVMMYTPKKTEIPIVKTQAEIDEEKIIKAQNFQKQIFMDTEKTVRETYEDSIISFEYVLKQTDIEFSHAKHDMAMAKLSPIIRDKDSLLGIYKNLPKMVEEVNYNNEKVTVENRERNLMYEYIANDIKFIDKVKETISWIPEKEDNIKRHFIIKLTFRARNELDAVDNPNGRVEFCYKHDDHFNVEKCVEGKCELLFYYGISDLFPYYK